MDADIVLKKRNERHSLPTVALVQISSPTLSEEAQAKNNSLGITSVLHEGGSAAISKRATCDVLLRSDGVTHSIPSVLSQGSYPSIDAYQRNHPRRVLVNFGPYVLLQTLGEGEFGKVKLGVHKDYGEEVAVKLIRRVSVDNESRLSKVEREVDVLKVVRHPNIVRLLDVIETEKYIGIILDFANGGELFDHILAHRYLKEKEAKRLFAQLVSGVNYLHQKKIVHRDLKLENLLLDKNRNVIITDFGFANRFEQRKDDLMGTSCGSPCYAAPELVISEGLYTGSAVDIWSCGVILYAMLSGYLPFDDDPSNPDGDNINLLYRYIVNTSLTFPDYLSLEARDILSQMLVPDPTYRCNMQNIMDHAWLSDYQSFLCKSLSALENIAEQSQIDKRTSLRAEMHRRREQQDAERIHFLAEHARRQETHQSAPEDVPLDVPAVKSAADWKINGRASTPPIHTQQSPSVQSAAVTIFTDNSTAQDVKHGHTNGSRQSSQQQAVKQSKRHTVQLEYDSVHRTRHPAGSCTSVAETYPADVNRSASGEDVARVSDLESAQYPLTGGYNLSSSGASPDRLIANPDSSADLSPLGLGAEAEVETYIFVPGAIDPEPESRIMDRDSSTHAGKILISPARTDTVADRSAGISDTGNRPLATVASSHGLDNMGANAASSNAARRVMDWFRRRSRKVLTNRSDTHSQSPVKIRTDPLNSQATSKQINMKQPVLPPSSVRISAKIGSTLRSTATEQQPTRTPSFVTPEAVMLGNQGKAEAIGLHEGVVDQAALSTKPPADIMKQVMLVLTELGVDYKITGSYRLQCTVCRGPAGQKGKRQNTQSVGSATQGDYGSSSNLSTSSRSIRDLVWRRPLKSPPLQSTKYFAGKASENYVSDFNGNANIEGSEDFRFLVELTQIRNLKGLLSLDIKRLRGNVWLFKTLYDNIIERCDLSH